MRSQRKVKIKYFLIYIYYTNQVYNMYYILNMFIPYIYSNNKNK